MLVAEENKLGDRKGGGWRGGCGFCLGGGQYKSYRADSHDHCSLKFIRCPSQLNEIASSHRHCCFILYHHLHSVDNSYNQCVCLTCHFSLPNLCFLHFSNPDSCNVLSVLMISTHSSRFKPMFYLVSGIYFITHINLGTYTAADRGGLWLRDSGSSADPEQDAKLSTERNIDWYKPHAGLSAMGSLDCFA